ncbi:hypothetical protein [Actinophytocola sediminis]
MAKKSDPPKPDPYADQRHNHVPGCYRILLACAKTEHAHVDGVACYKKDGTLKCHMTEHRHHQVNCYGTSLKCGYL